MVDTPRSLSAILALLADNSSGDISAQDMRDAVVSIVWGAEGGLERVNAVGATGASETIAITAGNVQTYTIDASCTFTMPSGLTSGVAISFTAICTDSGGSHTVTFTGVKWAGGTPPTFSTGSGAIDIFTFLTINGGTTWYGFVGGQDFS